jgi:hypothetical protein
MIAFRCPVCAYPVRTTRMWIENDGPAALSESWEPWKLLKQERPTTSCGFGTKSKHLLSNGPQLL